MAWNEPPNNNNDRDPWGNRPKGNDGPPDLDQIFTDFNKKLNKWLGGSGGSGGSSGNNSGKGGGVGTIVGVLLSLLLIVGLFNSWYTVDEQERAVVTRLGKFSSVEMPGLHFRIPLVDSYELVNVSKIRTYEHGGQMLTMDENIVDVRITVQYTVKEPKDFALNVRSPDVSLMHASESALRHVVGSALMDDVLTDGRAVLADEMKSRIQTYQDVYGTGVQVSKVNINDGQPPQPVKAAFDDVIKAREDQQRSINEAEAYRNQVVPVARGAAKRQIEEAEAYKVQKVDNAAGEAARFTSVLTEYERAPEVTRERLYLETLSEIYANSSKVIVDVEEGNSMMYLPLDQLKGRGFNNMGQSDISDLTDLILNEIETRQRRSN
jgi:membrane protease subunit HflK